MLQARPPNIMCTALWFLQVIEAHYLYGVDYDNIEIVIHPQSIIHSMVETADSSVLAQVTRRWHLHCLLKTLCELPVEPPDSALSVARQGG